MCEGTLKKKKKYRLYRAWDSRAWQLVTVGGQGQVKVKSRSRQGHVKGQGRSQGRTWATPGRVASSK